VSKTDKLLEKLKNGSIDAHDLRTLLKKLGWDLDHSTGSHEVWKKGAHRFILAAHGKDLKPYQIKEAKRILL